MTDRSARASQSLTSAANKHPRARQFAAWLRLWHRRHHTRQQLSRLDRQRLSDLGLSEGDRAAECLKWFWQE